MEYLADTNIYYNLVKDLTIEQVKNLAEKIQNTEIDLEVKFGLSITVAMELISHLQMDNPKCDVCYKALCLLYHHTTKVGKEFPPHSSRFYPTLNVILVKYFFNENHEELNFNRDVIELIHKLTEDFDISIISNYTEQINIVKSFVIEQKKEMQVVYENYLSRKNQGDVNWAYFRENKKERKDWLKSMRSGEISFYFAEGLMMKAFRLNGVHYERNETNCIKLMEFIDDFRPAFLMNDILINHLSEGLEALCEIQDKRWNTVCDYTIMFGMLFWSDRDNKILVSEDGAIVVKMTEGGMGDKIITLLDLKELLSI